MAGRYLLNFQALLHLPSLSFLVMLAAAVFWLPDEEFLPPIQAEARATDIVWSRYTPAGQAVSLSAPLLRRQADGTVNLENVSLRLRRGQHDAYLYGARGVTDDTYQTMQLAEVEAAFALPGRGQMTLVMKNAQYSLTDGSLEGEQVQALQNDSTITGNRLKWDTQNLHIRGNVRAFYGRDEQ